MKRPIGAILAVAVVLTSCGSTTTSVDLSSLNRNNVSTDLSPMENGFAFANFGSEDTSEQFDTQDLVEMFGASACVNKKTNPCIPTAQAAAWARMVNDARQSGHCEGLVVQASARFNEKAAPKTAKLPRDRDVIHGVIRAFATQFLPEVQDSVKEWSNRSLIDIVNELTRTLADGTTDYTMGLYTDGGGHAVLPYAVDFTSDTMAVIRVYDSNWPGMDRYVVIDFEKDQWYFSFSGSNPQQDECVWTGGPGDIDLTPLDTRTSANCPFCGDNSTVTKSMLLIRSTTNSWSVTTEDGTYSPSDGADVNGVDVRPIRTASCDTKTKLPEFVLSTESLDFEMTLPDDASAYISNGKSVIEIKTEGNKSRKPIVITDESISIDDPSATTTVSYENLAVIVTAPQATVSLDNNAINVAVTTNEGTQEVSVTPAAPHQQISVDNNQVVVTEPVNEVTSTTPDVPVTLQQNSQAANLPPVAERDLTNAEYIEEIKSSATTTTTTTTTSIKPRTSATTVAPSATISPSATNTPSATTMPSSLSTTTTPRPSATTTTTTTIPTATIRVLIPNGEGGIRFTIGSTQYPDSWGNPSWYDPNNQQNSTTASQCGPHTGSLCNNKTYVVPLGQNFIFDWALYNDNYLFEIQCGTGTSWYNPGTTYGNGSEVRSIGRCEISSVSGNTNITFRQR